MVLTRSSNKQAISNVQRTKIANKRKADAYIRIHANSASSSSVKGALTIAPISKNKYVSKKMRSKSYALSKQVLNHLCKQTGAKTAAYGAPTP